MQLVICTDVRSVGGVVRVRVDGEAVSEEGVDLVTAPDHLPRVSVADSLTVSYRQTDPLQVPDSNVADIFSSLMPMRHSSRQPCLCLYGKCKAKKESIIGSLMP